MLAQATLHGDAGPQAAETRHESTSAPKTHHISRCWPSLHRLLRVNTGSDATPLLARSSSFCLRLPRVPMRRGLLTARPPATLGPPLSCSVTRVARTLSGRAAVAWRVLLIVLVADNVATR